MTESIAATAPRHQTPASPSFTQPAPADVSALIGSTSLIRLALIDPSPFNPRKEFDAGEIKELAESIKAQGLLENLIVRPKAGGRFELMGGERRFRALKAIAAPEAKCNVIAADDAAAMAVQIVENLQRRDLGPLEEAEAFARLQAQDPKKWTAQEIAKAVGKTDRFVQQRLAIATNLVPDLKKKLGDGEISTEIARTLAAVPASLQNEIKGSWGVEQNNAAQVRHAVQSTAIPASHAKFDPKLYTGAVLEEGKKKYFLDIAQFHELQAVEARKMVETLKADWPDAKLITFDEAKGLQWADATYPQYNGLQSSGGQTKVEKYKVARGKCTAVVFITPQGHIRQAEGVCSEAAVEAAARKRASTSGTNARFKSPEGEKKEHKTERLAFNASIAQAAAKDVMFGDRLFILGAVMDDFNLNYDVINRVLPKSVVKARPGWNDPKGVVELWRQICTMSPAQARAAARDILLNIIPMWKDHDHKQKPELLVAMAETLGVKVPAIALPEPPKPKVEAAKAQPAGKTAAKPKPKAKNPAAKKGGKK